MRFVCNRCAQELRNEATQAVLRLGQQSQGEMFDMAKEYQRMTQVLRQKATENSSLRSDLRLAEQFMMEAKEVVKMSESREAFISCESKETKQAFQQEEQRTRSMAQEFQRLREVAAEEITAEREKYANLEANQRPILPSLHEEIMHLRQEVHAQRSELRVTRSELHAASARSSQWEHAGNSVGFSSTHASHTPVTIVSPVGSNSRNGSNVGTPEKHVEAPTPPAPQGPPVTYGPEHTAASSARKSSFRDFANDLFGESSKEMMSWGGPMCGTVKSRPNQQLSRSISYAVGCGYITIPGATRSGACHQREPIVIEQLTVRARAGREISTLPRVDEGVAEATTR